MRIFENGVNRFTANPRQLLLLDGMGAVLSAFLLGIVLVNLEQFVGIPRTTLYFLACIPCLFAAYDFYCYARITDRVGLCLKIIACANLFYIFTSLGLAIYHIQTITYLGWIYIALEILILIILVILEFKIASMTTSE